MQLSSLLRPEKVKKRWEEKRVLSEEYVFKMYDEILKEAVIDGEHWCIANDIFQRTYEEDE